MIDKQVQQLLRKSGWWFLGLFVLVPILIWIGNVSLALKFRSLVTTYTSIGQLTGLIGMVLFAESLFLSARWKWFEFFFQGMNQVYIAHHMVGGLALIFLLMHPIFLALVYAKISYTEAVTFLLPGTDWAINLGIASLYGLIALLILTFFVALQYEIWLKTHKYLGFVFFLGGLHSFFVESDISRIPALKWYMLIISAASLIAYTYRTLFPSTFVKKYEYAVTAVTQLPNKVIQITLSPVHKGLEYHSGQFIFIEFQHALFSGEAHPFSIASAPDEGGIVVIAVKALGDFTEKLTMLTVGTRALLEGPFGVFNALDSEVVEQIWIAGGIGVAPFVSMAYGLLQKVNKQVHVSLWYTVRNPEDATYLAELESIAAYDQRFQIIPHYSSQQGRLTFDRVLDKSDQNNPEIFICGPAAMMKSLKQQCMKKGIQKSRIHTEEFSMS